VEIEKPPILISGWDCGSRRRQAQASGSHGGRGGSFKKHLLSGGRLPGRGLMNYLCLCILVLLAAVTVCDATDNAEPIGENSDYFFACSDGELSKIETLLEKDLSLVHKTTKDGEHCLHLSALGGNAEIVKLLLGKGADPDVRSSWEGGMRMHPLSWSTFYGRYEIIELLLEAGADVNADFAFGAKNDDGKFEVGTVLDVVEQILLGAKDQE
jgi:ankyrin repeat protein